MGKPLINDDTTDMQVWYYYQIDHNGPDTAWKYEIIPPDGTYPIGNYVFNVNTKYYAFTSTKDAILGEDSKYNVKYIADEKNKKLISHVTDKETLEQHEYIYDITIQSSVPEGFTEVIVNTTPLGKWVQTMYLGSSKTNCEEITITTGMSLEGIITSDVFYNIIGESQLKIGLNIKDAINKIFDMLKENEDTVLSTNNKSIFEAINELHNKKYMDCYELIDSDLLNHCLSSEYKTLSSNFMYCENCTNTPKDNNGYGYAMLIVSQDTHYRQVIFFDPSNGKISSNNIGDNTDKTDFGYWSGWYSTSDELTTHTNDTKIHVTTADKTKWNDKLSRTDIATTIDENSIDKNPVGARAVYEKIKNMCTTTVTDVAKTNITSRVLNATVNPTGGVSYSVKNGICYVQFTSVTTTAACNGQYILPQGTLPSIDDSLTNGRYPVVGGGSKVGMVAVDGNTGGIKYYGGGMTIFTTISYPVKES